MLYFYKAREEIIKHSQKIKKKIKSITGLEKEMARDGDC